VSPLRVELVSPREGLIAAVASHLEAVGGDYSRAWVVFPEKRPGYYLRKALAEREGRGFIPPRLDSLETLVDRIHAERLGLGGRPADVMDAVAVLFELHRTAPRPLGGGAFLEADRFFPLGVKLFRDLEELAAAGASKEDLVRLDVLAEEAVPAETRERLQRLSFFSEAFYERLPSLGLTTPASRLRAVAERLDPALFPDVGAFFFAGFFSLAKLEAAVVRTLLEGEGSRLFLLKGRGIEEALDLFGVFDADIRAAASAPDPGPPPEVVLTKSSDTHGQIAALNAVLADRLADPSRLHERQVVVLPAAETLFPLYQQTLSTIDEERFNVSLGYPLSRTPVASFFERLLEVVQSMDEEGRVYVPHYLRFILHPYTKNVYFPGPGRRADLTRILVHAVEEALIEGRMKAFWSLEEIETDRGIRETVQARTAGVENAPPPAALLEHLGAVHAATIGPFLEIRDVGDFAAKLARVLEFIYERSTARLHRFFHPYAEAFMDRLESLARSLLRSIVFSDPASYAQLFRKVAAAGSVPFYGTPLGGLQVLGFWETRGIPFEEVHLLDANEGVLPASSRSDSLLPLAARLAVGLPSYREEERRMEYHLDVLVRGAKSVHLYFVENNDRERSRFVEKTLWEMQRRDGEKGEGRYLRTVEYRVDLAGTGPREVEKTPAVAGFLREFRYSATALDAYLKCPLGFYFKYVLGLREKEEAGEGVEKKDIGVLVHSILEDFFRPHLGRPLAARDLDESAMEEAVEGHFARLFGQDAGNPHLMKLQARRHLVDFLRLYQKPLAEGLEAEEKRLVILGLEQTLAGERGGFRLQARVDRTEKRGEGLFVLDFKTFHNTRYLGIDFERLDLDDRASWGRAIRSLQLPLYTMVLAQKEGLPSAEVHGRFVMLGRSRLGPEIEFSPYDAREKGAPEDPAARREKIAKVEQVIDLLLAEIADPGRPFEAAEADSDACRFCPFPALCGR